MIIPINLSSTSASSSKLPFHLAKLGNDEVVLIELQGSLEVEGDRAGQSVGTLKFDKDKPTLHIAHNLLEGKIVTLPKALAVLHRTYTHSAEHDEDEDDDPTPDASKPTSYDMIAIVKRKIVFAKRPMPVIGIVAGVPQSLAVDKEEGKRKKLKVG